MHTKSVTNRVELKKEGKMQGGGKKAKVLTIGKQQNKNKRDN
jgi:hypothetical protein